MSIYLFGCKDTTLQVANFLYREGIKINLITISPQTAQKNNVAGYLDLTKYASIFDTIYVAETYSLMGKNDVNYFSEIALHDVAFCVGWQRLIPSYILKKIKLGVHGMHGSARDLPFGKGRSPMNWSLIEGRKFFFTNLFKYMDGVDNGPIVDKLVFSIQATDTAETMHYKNTLSMCYIIKNNIDDLLNGRANYHKQNLIDGESFYSKREPRDGIIDWRDYIYNTERLIRAVAPPFYGAIASYKGHEFKIFRASIFYTDLEMHPFFHSKVGQILEIFPNRKFIIRCSGGVLIVHEFTEIDLSIGDFLDHYDSPFSNFDRNVYGFFDV